MGRWRRAAANCAPIAVCRSRCQGSGLFRSGRGRAVGARKSACAHSPGVQTQLQALLFYAFLPTSSLFTSSACVAFPHRALLPTSSGRCAWAPWGRSRWRWPGRFSASGRREAPRALTNCRRPSDNPRLCAICTRWALNAALKDITWRVNHFAGKSVSSSFVQDKPQLQSGRSHCKSP